MLSPDQITVLLKHNQQFRSLVCTDYTGRDISIEAYGNNAVLIRKPYVLNNHPWFFNDQVVWEGEVVRVFFKTTARVPLVIFKERKCIKMK